MPAIRQKLAESQNAILESNSVLKFLRPDIYLTVLDPATADFKKSAKEFMDRADAVILHQPSRRNSHGVTISMRPVLGRPLFRISPPQYVTPEIVEFVKEKLKRGTEAGRAGS